MTEKQCPECGHGLEQLTDFRGRNQWVCKNCKMFLSQMKCRAGYGGGLKSKAMEEKEMCTGDCDICPYVM